MISIISSTNRLNSNSLKVALKCQELLSLKSLESIVLSLDQLPSDFIFNNSFGKNTEDYLDLTTKHMYDPEKFIFVIPEYNGSFPGIVKAFIDSLNPSNLNHKKACLIGVSSGHSGALRALDQFTTVLHHLKIEVYSNKPKLSGIENLISNNELTDLKTIERLNGMLEEFVDY